MLQITYFMLQNYVLHVANYVLHVASRFGNAVYSAETERPKQP